jgi:hypothetical protein
VQDFSKLEIPARELFCPVTISGLLEGWPLEFTFIVCVCLVM